MSVTTTARLDTARLAVELGADVWTSGAAPTSTGSKVVTSTVSDAALQAAITAHVFVDTAANEATIRSGLAASIAALKADIDQANLDIAATNATINAGPAPYIKNLERALKNTDRALLRLLKIAAASFSDTDLGAA